VYVGDTIHHMLPKYAQGGCSTLEDAAALSILFYSKSISNDLPTLQMHLGLY